jgi:hypothetical protein
VSCNSAGTFFCFILQDDETSNPAGGTSDSPSSL